MTDKGVVNSMISVIKKTFTKHSQWNFVGNTMVDHWCIPYRSDSTWTLFSGGKASEGTLSRLVVKKLALIS